MESIDHIYPHLDTLNPKLTPLSFVDNPESLKVYLDNNEKVQYLLGLSSQIRSAGITYTPTIFINDNQLIGNMGYKRLENAILDEFAKCD